MGISFLGHHVELAIFDLDGTLLDSTGIWEGIDRAFFARRGRLVPPSYAKEIAHIGLVAASKLTQEKYCPNEFSEDILQEWHDASVLAYRDEVGLKRGAKELLDYLKANQIKIAYATANSKALFVPTLKRLGIEEYFDYGVDADICYEGKNSSIMYDMAANHFGIAKQSSLVFEDSLLPMRYAQDAGYPVIGVYDAHSTKNKAEHEGSCLYFATDFLELLPLLKEEG